MSMTVSRIVSWNRGMRYVLVCGDVFWKCSCVPHSELAVE